MERFKSRKILTGAAALLLVLACLAGLNGCGFGKQENPMIVVEAQDNSASPVRYDEKNPVVFSFVKEENAVGEVTYELAGAKDEKGKDTDAFALVSENNNRIQMKEGTPAGTYSLTIKVKAAGDDEYRAATKEIKYLFTVDKAVSVMKPPTAVLNLVYTGSPQTLVTAGSSEHGTVLYKLDDGEYSDKLPSATESGIYTVYYRLQGDENHQDIKEAYLLVSISRGGSSAGSSSYPSVSYYSGGGSTSIYDIINKGSSIATRTPVSEKPGSDVTFVYDGLRHDNGYVVPAGVVAIGESSGTTAGRYMAVYTPDITHCWPDGTVTPVRVTLTIEKADPSVSIEVRDLSYDGTFQEAFEPAAVDGGLILYSLDGNNYSTGVPAIKDVGEYTVYYRVIGDLNHNDASGSVTVRMGAGSLPKPVAADTHVYNGLPHWPELSGYDPDTMSLAPGGTHVAISAGTYEFEIELDDPRGYTWEDGTTDNAVITWSIEKAPGRLGIAPEGKDLIYNGRARRLVSAGTSPTGDVLYRLGEEGEYSKEIPEATDAGMYRIYYYSAGDANHFDTQPEYVITVIANAQPVIDAVPSAVDVLYTGGSVPLAVPGESGDGSFQYRLDEGEWSFDVPEATEPGDYTVEYRFIGDDNHTDAEGGQFISRIRMNEYAEYETYPMGIEIVYDAEEHELLIPGSAIGGTMQYRMADGEEWSDEVPSATDAGTYYIFYRIKGDSEHHDTDPGILTSVIAPAKLSVQAPDQAFVYNGEYQGDPVKAFTADGTEAKVEYRTGASYGEEVPRYRDVMTDAFGKVTDRRVYYRVSAPNHESAEGSYTIAILRRSYGIPYLDNDVFVYDGTEQGPAVTGFIEEAMTMSGMDRSDNAGAYRISVSLRDTKNTQWADGSNGTKALDWYIIRALVEIPTLTDTRFVYDGTEHAPVIEGADSSLIRVSGDLSAVESGVYTVRFSLKNVSDYRWSDGTKGDKTFTWTIARAEVGIPYLSGTEFTYDGTEQGPGIIGFDPGLMKMSGMDKAVYAGEYGAYIELTDTDNYRWSDGTDGMKMLYWTIFRAVVEEPVMMEEEFVYDGTEHSPVFDGFDPAIMRMRGDMSGVDSDDYDIYVSLRDRANYEWPDGSGSDRRYTWAISSVHVNIPVRTDDEEFVYDGTEHAPVLSGFDDKLIIMSGDTSAVNAGEYVITFELADPKNYLWDEDYSSETKTLSWSIAKATVAVPSLAEDSFAYTAEPIVPELVGLDEDLVTVYGQTQGTDADEYHIHIALKDPANYRFENGSEEDLDLPWEITRAVLPIPRLEEDELVYNGSVQSVTIIGYDEATMKLTGMTEAKIVGGYRARVDLIDKDNYVWENGTTDMKMLDWEIVKATLARPELKEKSLSYTGEEQSPVIEGLDETLMKLYGQTGATDVGKYELHVALNDRFNYQWDNRSEKDLTLKWEIVPASVPIPYVASPDYTYDGTEKSAVLEGFDPGIMELEGELTGVEADMYLLTFTLKDTANYVWEDGTKRAQYDVWFIDPALLEVPSLSQDTFIYDGTNHSPAVEGYDASLMTLTGTFGASEAGKYTIVADLTDKNNYAWDHSDGLARYTTDPYVMNWEIEKAPVELVEPEVIEGLRYTGAQQALVTPGSAVGGDIWFSTDGIHYTSSVPVRTDEGSYRVYYKITGDANHKDAGPVRLSASIAPALISATFQDQSYAYDGLPHGFGVTDVMTVNGTGYRVRYGYSEGSCTAPEPPVMTDANVRTIYFVINADHHETYRGSYELCVRPAPGLMEVMPVAAEGLVYDFGGQSLLASGGASSTGTVLYSIDGTDYSEAIPVVTDAGNYTVYCYSAGDVNHLDTPVVAIPVSVARLTVAMPAVTDTEYIYDGESHRPTIFADNVNSFGQGVFGAVYPGEYTFTYLLVDDANMCWSDGTSDPLSFSWRIIALDPEFAAYPAPREELYTGYPIQLVSDGEAIGGTIVYSLDGENFVPAGELTATEAGMYPVYYKIRGDLVHNDSDIGMLYSQIIPGQAVVTSYPSGIDGLVFTGGPQTLIVPGEGNYPGAEILYSVNGSDFTDAVPAGTGVGSYIIQYMIPDAPSYRGTGIVDTIVVSIGRAPNPVHGVSSETHLTKAADEVKVIDVTEFTGLPAGETVFALTGVDGIEDYTDLIAMENNLIAMSNFLAPGEYVLHFTVYAAGTVEYEEKLVETSIRVTVEAPVSLAMPGDGSPGIPQEGELPEEEVIPDSGEPKTI